jgi:hypothetical protein
MSKVEALTRIGMELGTAFTPLAARRALIHATVEAQQAQPGATEADLSVVLQQQAQTTAADHLPYLVKFSIWLAQAEDAFSGYRDALVQAGWSQEEATNIIAGLRKAAGTIDLKPMERVA